MMLRNPPWMLATRIALATLVAGLAAAQPLPTAAVDPPKTMHAVRIHAFGGPDVLKYEQAPRPEPADGQVLVKVHAAGVNPVDWKIRSGKFGGGALPMILGLDVSGTVESLGANVTNFKPGDEVFAYLRLRDGGGYAEYISIPADILTPKPTSIDHIHAAGVPLAAMTAWQAMFDVAKLKEGQTILIHAGAGGVGHFAVQLAKAKGAKVIATASKENLEFLKEIGADEVIDYKSQQFEELVKDVDVVLDPIGGDTQERSMGVIKKGGYLVSIVQPPSQAKLKEHGISGSVMLVHPDATQLAQIAKLIDEGKVKSHVSDVFPLQDASKAHVKSQTGRTRGKIVLYVAEDAAEKPGK